MITNSDNEHDHDLEFYADGSITSKDAPIPLFIFIVAGFLIVGTVFAAFFFWNGSQGWLDRGYWKELQEAANTTYPYRNLQNE